MDNEETKTGEEPQQEGSPEPEEEQEQQPEAEPETTEDEEEGEIVVSIDDGKQEEEEDQNETEWLKDLRKSWKTYKRENKELKEELKKLKEPTIAKAPDPGAKPTLEACDYDTEAYDKKLSDWYEAKRLHEEETRRAKQAQEKENEQWQKQLNRYHERKSKLPVKDYEDVEMVVEEILNPTQQGIIVQGAKNPELVVYALGKNPRRAKDIASIKNPVNFAFAVAELEAQLKTSKRKPATEPEKTMQSTGRISGTTDNTLEKLRKEAEKTGDYTPVVDYRRKKRKASAA